MVVGGQSKYERELRDILVGEVESYQPMLNHLPIEERIGYESLNSMKFLVVRSAGSLGLDLVAMRGEFSFPIEVKASATKKIRLSRNKRLQEQYQELIKLSSEARVLPLYAYRLKGIRKADPWRIYTIRIPDLTPVMSTLAQQIPTLSTTNQGGLQMDWNRGMKLCMFLQLCHALVPNEGAWKL
jgi:Holliday junction resolvase